MDALKSGERVVGTGPTDIPAELARSSVLSLFYAGMHVKTEADVTAWFSHLSLPAATADELDRSDCGPGKSGGGQATGGNNSLQDPNGDVHVCCCLDVKHPNICTGISTGTLWCVTVRKLGRNTGLT